ncbi:TetR/AcrR family transcriptional regulator [Myxococcota bacterium]|nr:TetR/AcrR family transcriptional regulator [Myxococcota bacterium]
MARSPRSEAELNRTRAAILDAAARAFALRGFEGLTMEDLAREAGYSTASLYNYFPGKEAVFRALVDRSLERMLRAVDASLPVGLEPEQRLELVTLRLLEEAREHHWLTSLLISPALGSGQVDPGSLTAAYLSVHDRFMAAMATLVAAVPWVPPEQAPRLALHLVSAIRTENLLWLAQGPPEDLPPLAHALLRFWVAGARALLEPT